MKKILLIIPIIFLLTGCYNYREINELAIVSGISVTKEGNDIKLTTEVINPKKNKMPQAKKNQNSSLTPKKQNLSKKQSVK